MSDQSDGAQSAAQFSVLGQFVKDLSFENHGVSARVQQQGKMGVNVDFGVRAGQVGPEQYEVLLTVEAKTNVDGTPLYTLEIEYGGVVQVKNVPQEHMGPLLMIEAPRLLFPFARRIVADVTRDGGYQPLLLEPLDFVALYRTQMERQRQADASGQIGNA
jgi:preprotein translocase subunit SecB